MFELFLKDEFLPIYTHIQYARMFKDTSIAMEISPKRSVNKKSVMSSPGRESTTSKRSS